MFKTAVTIQYRSKQFNTGRNLHTHSSCKQLSQ